MISWRENLAYIVLIAVLLCAACYVIRLQGNRIRNLESNVAILQTKYDTQTQLMKQFHGIKTKKPKRRKPHVKP